jgi:subtilisin-like proprotein convertase family protein
METHSQNSADSTTIDPRPPTWRRIMHKAQRHFGEYSNCLGVNYCERRKGTSQDFIRGEHVIAVYVSEKKNLKRVPENEIIDGFEGYPTDVVEVFSKARPTKHLDYIKDRYRSHDLASLDLTELNARHLRRTLRLPEISRIGNVGQVCIVEDREGRLVTEENGELVPDLAEAYKVFVSSYGDEFDFVTFFSDTASGMPSFDTSFHWGAHNEVDGIGRERFNHRPRLNNSNRLQSIHFIHSTQMNRYVMLQEVGHRWGAFVAYRDTANGPDNFDLLVQDGAGAYAHWNMFLNSDSSPMDYDIVDWNENPDGTFSCNLVSDRDRRYCNLDLYLMGLINAQDVGAVYYLRGIQPTSGDRYRAEKRTVNIQNIIFAEGERKPDGRDSQKAFRHAFVLLTKNYENARSHAVTIDRFRSEFQNDFGDATRNLARLDTSLGTATIGRGFIRQEYARRTPIPDKTAGTMPKAIEREFYFAASEPVSGIEVSLDIAHTFVGDLEISLISPDHTAVVLHNRSGSSESGVRSTYTEENTPALGSLIGKSGRGTWKLRITDVEEADEGTLNYWNLTLGFG